eukprot:TRINITY_DN7474_c0_g1_i10.p1 TRINITY_DN7474_c0_g1~~TRINITY_DN7474_c0_g1_i10.p1  ORF type:complete len:383 (+),score=139.48 TRINITY_DN7474_c0_g1_i10:114-1262(+)
MIRRPPRSTLSSSSAASDVYKRQVDKLLKMSTAGAERSAEDLSLYRSNPQEMAEPAVGDDGKPASGGEEEGMEMPELDEPDEEELVSKKRKRRERSAKMMERSGMLEEMRAELGDGPDEVNIEGTRRRIDEEAAQKVQYEENTFTRLLTTKADKKKAKQNGGLERFDPLADMAGIADTFGGMEDEPEDKVASLMKRKSLKSQLRKLSQEAATNKASGDADLPYTHGKKKSYYEPEGEGEGEDGDDFGGEEEFDPVVGNHLYESVKAQMSGKKAGKKARREEAEAAERALISTVDEDVVKSGTAKRGASKKIIRNVGLVKYRNKDLKNPRVANRIKSTRKGKKLKTVSAAANMRSQDKPYSGEATGIKSHLVKSQPLTGAVRH